MEPSDGNIILGELVVIKDEDTQIKEEELDIKEECTFFSEIEGMYSQGWKRSLSPSLSQEMAQGSKRQLPNAEEIKSENEQTMNFFNLCRDSGTGSGPHSSIGESPMVGRKINNARNTEQLTTQTRRVVMNIHDYFRSRNQLLSETDLQIKVAAATGISVRTVQRVKKQAKEGRLHSPPPVRNRQSPVIDSIDDFSEGCIRREILSFYERGEIPTLSTLLDIVKQPPIDFQGGRTSLSRLIKKIGFRYMRMPGGRQILIEREEIVASRCKFLRVLGNNRNSSNSRTEVYVDETWVSQKERVGTGKEVQFIIVHAGGENGFVPGGLLTIKPQTTNKGHYQNVITSECFQIWFKEQLLPNIPDNSLIIMDNASCHLKFANKVPNRSMKKCDIIQWVEENNIVHDRTASKSELLHLVNCNKEKLPHEIDLIAHDHGHEVLRLPLHHNHLNPMELVWHQVKAEMKRKSQADQTLQTVEELINDAIARVTVEDWRMYMHHTREIEEEYKNKDMAVDHMLETLTTSLDEPSTDEED